MEVLNLGVDSDWKLSQSVIGYAAANRFRACVSVHAHLLPHVIHTK